MLKMVVRLFITIYFIPFCKVITIQSSFWLSSGQNRDLLEDRHTADAISMTSIHNHIFSRQCMALFSLCEYLISVYMFNYSVYTYIVVTFVTDTHLKS